MAGFLVSKQSISVRKIVNLIVEVAEWGFIGYIFMLLFGIKLFDIKEMIKVMFPVITGGRWFVKAYIIYFLFVPFINKSIINMNKESHKKLLIIMFFLFCIWPSFIPIPPVIDDYGYGFIHFIFIYTVISYIKLHVTSLPNKNICLISYLIFSLLTVGSRFLNLCMSWAYNHLFVVCSAVSLFLYFVQLDIKSKYTNILSSCSFGVFLIHTDGFFSWLIYDKIFQATKMLNADILILISTFFICLPTFYLFGWILEMIRKRMIGLFLNKVIDKILILNRTIYVK